MITKDARITNTLILVSCVEDLFKAPTFCLHLKKPEKCLTFDYWSIDDEWSSNSEEVAQSSIYLQDTLA